MKKVLVLVEHDPAPIRHGYAICPDCGSKFMLSDVFVKRIDYDYQLFAGDFCCPICNNAIETNADTVEVKEVPYPECAKNCKEQVTIWR